MTLPNRVAPALICAILAACQPATKPDGGPIITGPVDAGEADAGVDAGLTDAGSVDAGLLDGGPVDAGVTDGGFKIGAFPTPPQVQTGSGTELTSPVLVPVFFPGDSDPTASVADMTAFFQGLGASQYWTYLSNYGIESVSGVTPYTMSSPAPATIDDSDIPALLGQGADGGVVNPPVGGIPMNQSNTTLYVINFPSTTTVTLNGLVGCTDFTAYHSSFNAGSEIVPYVVVPRCPAAGALTTDLQQFTVAASQQIVNAVTNPFPYSYYSLAWYQVDSEHYDFNEANGGSEIGDLCSQQPGAAYQFSDFPYSVQRFWGNIFVTGGHDPCVPGLPNEVFFNTVPVLKSTGVFDTLEADALVDSVNIAVGQSATITLDLYSDAPTSGPWSVQVQDGSALLGGPTLLTFNLSTASGSNGDQLPLTITVNAAGDGTHQTLGTELFIVTSTLGTGSSAVSHVWYGVVTSADPLSVPQVVNYGGGILASAAIVPIFYSNDNDPTSTLSQMTDFYEGLSASSYWATVAEYGVGPLASATPVTLTAAAATSVDDNFNPDGGLSPLQASLEQEIESGEIPTNVENSTLYVINYPTGTTVNAGGDSCTEYLGYHDYFQRPNGDLAAYAVIPRCTAEQGGVSTDLQTLTTTASHELVEGTTDPYITAWVEVDDPHYFWNETNSGSSEIADMCEYDPQANYQFPDFPFLVQRIWSNAATKAGHDPCVPAMTDEIYFKAVPELNGAGVFDEYYPYVVQSVNIAVGQSATIPVDLAADGSAGTFSVSTLDYDNYYLGTTALLSLTLSQSTGQSGDTVMLTIKVNAAGDGNDQPQNTEAFALVTQQGTGTSAIYHFWWGVVTN